MLHSKEKFSLVPTSKMDWDAINRLESASEQQIKNVATSLLEWVQDYNWPITTALAQILSQHVNSIQNELIAVLRTNDDMWKSVCLTLIIEEADTLSQPLIDEIRRIAHHPTKSELGDEQDETAKRILQKLAVD